MCMHLKKSRIWSHIGHKILRRFVEPLSRMGEDGRLDRWWRRVIGVLGLALSAM